MLIPRKKVNPPGQICLFLWGLFLGIVIKELSGFPSSRGSPECLRLATPSLAIFISADVFLLRY